MKSILSSCSCENAAPRRHSYCARTCAPERPNGARCSVSRVTKLGPSEMAASRCGRGSIHAARAAAGSIAPQQTSPSCVLSQPDEICPNEGALGRPHGRSSGLGTRAADFETLPPAQTTRHSRGVRARPRRCRRRGPRACVAALRLLGGLGPNVLCASAPLPAVRYGPLRCCRAVQHATPCSPSSSSDEVSDARARSGASFWVEGAPLKPSDARRVDMTTAQRRRQSSALLHVAARRALSEDENDAGAVMLR
jgi:hypothetical protein